MLNSCEYCEILDALKATNEQMLSICGHLWRTGLVNERVRSMIDDLLDAKVKIDIERRRAGCGEELIRDNGNKDAHELS